MSILILLASMTLLDWGLIAALPKWGLSFGPVSISVVFMFFARLGAALMVFSAAWLLRLLRRSEMSRRAMLGVLLTVNLIILAAEVDAFYIEPFALQTTRLPLAGPETGLGRPLRILHLTDLHVERITRRERDLLARVERLQPDLIVLTGDYPNIDYNTDPLTLQDTRQVLAGLRAPYGVYAVSGSPPVDTPAALDAILPGLEIEWLQDEVRRVALPGGEITLVGVSNLGHNRDAQVLQEMMATVSPDSYSLLLYHTPDLAYHAAEAGVDLYLAGHTHGGQVRVPLYGAIITMSRFHKQFESGWSRLEGMDLYVSRGIGLEGLNLPRVRFFCPPEIVLVELE